jgi:RpiR family glv operon transcriptional regulator
MNITDGSEQFFDKLNETDVQILNYIRDNKQACCSSTIERLAAKCKVSRTTILRFAQKLGFTGFSEMKVRLKWECEKVHRLPEDALEIVCDDYHKLITDMKEKNCDDICRTLHTANRVFVYGTGAIQTNVARELQRSFLSARLFVHLIEGTIHETELVSDTIGDRDVVIVISLTGETEYSMEFARALKLRNVKIISLTKLQNNPLARLSDYSLYVNTASVNSIYSQGYETTAHFFRVVEILMLKYLSFLQTNNLSN